MKPRASVVFVAVFAVVAVFVGCDDETGPKNNDTADYADADGSNVDGTDLDGSSLDTDGGAMDADSDTSDETSDDASSDSGDDADGSAPPPDTAADGGDTGDSGSTGGCDPLSPCESDEYCDYDPNTCGADGDSGSCKASPVSCPRVVNPVCGCDGKTYNNECEAHASGVDIEFVGKCQTSSGCSSDSDCSSGEYCKFPSNACSGSNGTCDTKPSACRKIKNPVCGCDGKTYLNKCKAAAAGVNVASNGKCQTSAGCSSDSDCASGEYCNFPNMACSGSNGSCDSKPSVCTSVYKPVCGCDGMTYGNKCKAASAGVNVDSSGKCSP